MNTDCLGEMELANFISAIERIDTAIKLLAYSSEILWEREDVAGLNVSEEFRNTIRRLDEDKEHLCMVVDSWSHTITRAMR